MLQRIDVLIIGTDPPCPRCGLLEVMVNEVSPPHLKIDFQHCDFNSLQAKELAQRLCCKIGTAKRGNPNICVNSRHPETIIINSM